MEKLSLGGEGGVVRVVRVSEHGGRVKVTSIEEVEENDDEHRDGDRASMGDIILRKLTGGGIEDF